MINRKITYKILFYRDEEFHAMFRKFCYKHQNSLNIGFSKNNNKIFILCMNEYNPLLFLFIKYMMINYLKSFT